MKLLKRITVLAVIWIIVYLVIARILVFTEMSYCAWVDVSGKITILWILPLLGIAWTGVWLKKYSVWNRIVKTILIAVEAAAYVCWVYLSLWFLIFSINSEKQLTPDLLVRDESDFFGETQSHYVYYRPVSAFFMIPGEVTAEDKKEYLEKKYNREFEIDYTAGNVIYDTEFPDVSISIGLESSGFTDDLVEGVLTACLSEGMEELDIDREYYVSEYSGKTNGIFFIQLKEESDIPRLAEDISRLLAYACGRTTFFEESRGYLYFYCGEINGQISFGKPGRWDETDSDYYLYPEKLEEYIRSKYEAAVKTQREHEERQEDLEEYSQTPASQEAEEEYIDPIETNAKIIYDAVLAEQGYSCEVCYNAKGNLYIKLGSRPAGEDGDQYNTGTYSFTLVYDRTSKNGACELFVLYKEHYTEENGMGQSDGAAILNMYAVEVGTGKVVAADKRSWGDVGTEEYRELTGE